MTRLVLTLDIILWHVGWNNSFSLNYGWGENQGEKKQAWLNASHFAKCSSGQYITRKWTDRLRKRTERHQWSIVCSQGAPFQLLWQSIYQRNQNILHHLHWHVLQIQITSFVFLWLNKSIKNSYVSKQVCVSMLRMYTYTYTYTHTRTYVHKHTHTQTELPPKVWNLSNPSLQLPFNAGKMHYLCAAKWTLCYSFKAESIFHTEHCSTHIYI